MEKINLDKNKRLEDIYIYIYKLFPDCVTETKVNDKTTYKIDFDKLKDSLKTPIIFDGRNQYDAKRLAEKGFEYFQIGKI